MALNWPLSTLPLTWPRAATTAGLPAAQPMRPAGHVERFAEGVKFNGDVEGAGDFKDAARGFFEINFAVGEIVGDHPAVLVGEGDGFFVEHSAYAADGGGIVRIVQARSNLAFLA